MGRVIEQLCGEKPQVERRLKYADRRRMMENWCAENIDSIITPDELAEVGGVSYATAMKFINERIDLFRKVERGRYIVRDLRAEK
jgi:predicted transcriptional regulator of viral defense system